MMAARWTSALVTGASSGIGREVARQVAARGADLIVVARRADRLAALAGEVRSRYGRDVEVLVADLTDPQDLAAVERRVADPGRPVDLVVNNAGFGGNGRFHERPVDREDAEVRLNALALLRLSHAALAAMVPRQRGGLLNVASLAGFQALPYSATYAASKAFVLSLTEALHEEVKASGVHVTALCPGFTRTDLAGKAPLPDFVLSSPDAVARAGLDAVTRNEALCVPGTAYRSAGAVISVLPRAVLRRITSLVARRM